jgi:hypothetical protein
MRHVWVLEGSKKGVNNWHAWSSDIDRDEMDSERTRMLREYVRDWKFRVIRYFPKGGK